MGAHAVTWIGNGQDVIWRSASWQDKARVVSGAESKIPVGGGWRRWRWEPECMPHNSEIVGKWKLNFFEFFVWKVSHKSKATMFLLFNVSFWHWGHFWCNDCEEDGKIIERGISTSRNFPSMYFCKKDTGVNLMNIYLYCQSNCRDFLVFTKFLALAQEP